MRIIIWLAMFCVLLTVSFSFLIKENKPSMNSMDSITFTKHVIHDTFISEGVAVGDVNRDGLKDIIANFYWFEAPEWKVHEIQKPQNYDFTKGYSNSFLNYTMDVNFDGWLDFIFIGFPGEEVYWFENPKGKEVYWTKHLIDSNACNESPMFVDIDDNGRMDLVFGNENTGTMMWLRSPDSKNDLDWTPIPISKINSPGTKKYDHGLGYGDVNNDGRNDIIITHGWWEAPLDRKQVPWRFHKTDFGKPCSQMYVYDFDRDGDNDIISASAHKFGIWWHENISNRDDPGFSRHLIDSTFSQTHGLAFTDMNKDGLPDIITGKRFFAHQGKDPGGLDPAVLYWYELQMDEDNNPSWIPHLIDDNSGAGLQVVIDDLNNDGKLDIINSNKKGVIYFLQD
ncbi:MAG: VCBS repeat-containing protein [Flavobacteriaceae bacterium]|nr:VCBS repeat-containing protein [Flavobacteriaceae bacterium]